jgi:hypothetical protein
MSSTVAGGASDMEASFISLLLLTVPVTAQQDVIRYE